MARCRRHSSCQMMVGCRRHRLRRLMARCRRHSSCQMMAGCRRHRLRRLMARCRRHSSCQMMAGCRRHRSSYMMKIVWVPKGTEEGENDISLLYRFPQTAPNC
ncbi:unnamed protein product [Prunus armeniaca]